LKKRLQAAVVLLQPVDVAVQFPGLLGADRVRAGPSARSGSARAARAVAWKRDSGMGISESGSVKSLVGDPHGRLLPGGEQVPLRGWVNQ
jgi:hypothetical protein